MLQSRQRTQAPRAVGDTSVAVRFAQDGQDAAPLPGAIAFFRYGFQLCRKSPDKDQRDDCRRASPISSARRAASSSARSSSYKEKRSFGSGAIIRCKTRAVGPDTFGAIARNSDGRCFNAYKSVAEFVLLSIGAFPATA